MDQGQLSPKVFTFTEISEGVEIFKAHSYGNGHFIHGIPSEGLEVCFKLKKSHDTLDIQINDVNLLQWLQAIPSLHDGFVADATLWSINMARLLPYYYELREKFNQDRIQGLAFNALRLFILHFLPDRSIFAIFGLEDLYQAGTLTEVHFHDLDSWDWDCSMSKDLDCLDEIVNQLDERGELDNLDESDEPDEPDEPNEPDEQDKEEPCHPVTLTYEPIQFELPLEPFEQDKEELWNSVALIHEPIRSELRALIRQGDLEAVKRVLDMTLGRVDTETLSIAVKSYRPDIFCQLLEHGAQVDGDGFSSPLCDAAKYGNKKAVQLLLSRGANIEGGIGGWTPLTNAACNGHFEIVRYLVDEQGANANGALFECPLSYAIENGHTRIVDYLLKSGADAFKGRRPRYSHDPSSCWPFKEPASFSPGRDSPWFRAGIYTRSFRRLVANCCAHTRYLLLSRAAADGDLELVEYLISFGVDVNSTKKESPLYRATKNRQSDVVRFLLRHATDVQPANFSYLLWRAAKNDDLDTISLLLGCGPRLYPRLLNKLLSIAGYSGVHYQVEADGNAHDGLLLRLPKDESFHEWDSWGKRSLYGDRERHLRRHLLNHRPRNQSKRRRTIIDKLVAKIVSALEKPSNASDFHAFIFFESTVQRLPHWEVTDLKDRPVVAAIQAQERRTIFCRLFLRIASSQKSLLHVGASQDASTGLVNFAHKTGPETSRAIWRRGTRVIRNIGKGRLPSSLPEIVSILQVANAMRSAVPASDLVCSVEEFVNDIPKWAALLNQEDQRLFLEIAEHLWGRPSHVEISPTPDTSSILEDLKRLVNSLMKASGLVDDEFDHSGSWYRLQPLRQLYLPGISPSHTYEGDPPSAERRPLPAPDLQETPNTNASEPLDPEEGPSSILRNVTYLMTGAIFGAILLFLCLLRYSYLTLPLPILASHNGQGSDLDQIMNRNCLILALYIGSTSCVSLGSWRRTDHLPVPTSLSPDKPESDPRGRAEERLATFESRSENAFTTIDPPDAFDTATEDAPPGCSPKLQSQAPTSSSVTSVSPSTTTTATPPDLTRAAVSEDGTIHCKVGSCTSRFKPGKSQKGNYNKHLKEQHVKEVMYECKWEGCDRKRSVRFNVELHEKTCKKRRNGNKANFGQTRRRL